MHPRSPLARLFLLTSAFAVLAGCSASSDAAPGDDCTSIGPARLPSQSCCPALGTDACGAGLFCAAFDGRDVPTCYAEHERPDMAQCTADVQCLSGSCNTKLGACRSVYGQPCTEEIGCAPGSFGSQYACEGAFGTGKGTCRPTS